MLSGKRFKVSKFFFLHIVLHFQFYVVRLFWTWVLHILMAHCISVLPCLYSIFFGWRVYSFETMWYLMCIHFRVCQPSISWYCLRQFFYKNGWSFGRQLVVCAHKVELIACKHKHIEFVYAKDSLFHLYFLILSSFMWKCCFLCMCAHTKSFVYAPCVYRVSRLVASRPFWSIYIYINICIHVTYINIYIGCA